MYSTPTPWDFRDEKDLILSQRYENDGFAIMDANYKYLELMKQELVTYLGEFTKNIGRKNIALQNTHQLISHEECNNLRLYIMQKLSKTKSFNKYYYYAAKELIHSICGNELAMQKRPGLSINLPNNESDVLPIHADTWNGVSPYELNIWIPLVDCKNSMCLYILKRNKYHTRLNDSKGLLRLTSDELFTELQDDLTWIPINYGEVLAFDQALPHGYTLNKEVFSHWSMNCRFKGIHTPYWDKKLGEYFMPITVRSSTRLGMNYTHPNEWI